MAKKNLKGKKKPASPPKKQKKPVSKGVSKNKAKSKPAVKKPVKKAAAKSSKALVKKKPVAVKSVKKVLKKSVVVKKTKAKPVKPDPKTVKPLVKKKAELKPVPKKTVPAIPAKVVAPKKEEKVKPVPAAAATGKKKKEAEPEKPKSGGRRVKHIVLPRPPMFPRKFEEPLPPLPKVTGDKKQYKIEFEIKASPRMLYNYLSTPSGLSAWFANNVNIRDGVFTFFWDGSTARAKDIAHRDSQYMVFQWLDEKDNSYFVFEIVQDEITGDVALIITDFALPGEVDQNMRLWSSQIQALQQVIGT